VGNFLVACSFRSAIDNFVWSFRLCGVYGLNDDGVRKYHWDELVGLMSWWELMWCIGGDFNVWFPSERSGDSRQPSSLVDFLDFIFE
jgi:hypothetical protein